MFGPGEVFREVLFGLRRHARALVLYHLFFSILASVLLLPASSWLLTTLLTSAGKPAVTNFDILAFVLSPVGLFWVLAAATLTLTWIIADQAGMIVIAASSARGRYTAAMAALWHIGRRLPRFLTLTGLRVAGHLGLSVPLLLAILGLYHWQLGAFDIYYVVNEQPPAVWRFLAMAAPLALLLLVGNALLYIRWVLAVPILLLQDQGPWSALLRSAASTRRLRLQIALAVLPVALCIVLLPVLGTLVVDLGVAPLLGILPEESRVLIPATLLVITLAILLTIAGSFVGIGLNGLVVYALYRRIVGRSPKVETRSPEGSVFAIWGVELAVLAFALFQASQVLAAFDFTDEVEISAHRGSATVAPENTLAAIEQAILDGADYVEIDVRETADGVPVLLHDRDLRRVAGDDRRIWEVRSAELAAIDVGSSFDPAFAGEPIPTLVQAIEAVRGRAKLYIEIKPAPETPRLVRRVVETLEAEAALEGTIVASMSPAVLDTVHRLEPALRRAQLVHTSIGRLDQRGYDILALREALVDPNDVVAAKRLGYALHVWTVNEPGAMSRLIDMGVDNIITDEPAILRDLLDERAALTDAERLVIKIRNWLRF
jgi:glycerophosphoryl diester phosphodiesterase